MPQPSACGFPDVSTTGVKPGARLTRAAGTVTLSTPGEVYQNKSLRGSIVVTADHVTIRNVKLISTAFYAIQSFNVRGLKVQDTEIDMGGHLDARAISDDGFTLTRVFMHNGADCTTMGDAVTIEDSLCVLGPDANGDGWPDSTNFCSGAEHFDGFQSDGGHDLVIRHNTIRNPCGQTSAILMSSNSAPISDVTITDNLLAGGGYTLYCNAGPDIPNEKVTDNRVARTYRPLGATTAQPPTAAGPMRSTAMSGMTPGARSGNRARTARWRGGGRHTGSSARRTPLPLARIPGARPIG